MTGELHDFPALELPPRARRIPTGRRICAGHSGTTSACAENTVEFSHKCSPFWNYLRVRGEYSLVGRRAAVPRELPPRARRIH